MAQQHAVGAGVSDDRYAQIGLLKVPHRQCLARPVHAARRPMIFGARSHTLDEIAWRLSPAGQTVPPFLGGALAIFLVRRSS